MNLKYYLRGLGLGIIVTAVFLGLTVGKRNQTMSDAQIIARAKELGMIENTVLSQYSETNKETKEAEKQAEAEPQPEEAQPEEVQPEVQPETPQPETTQPETPVDTLPEEEQAEEPLPAAEEEQQVIPETEEKSFSVQKGDGSHTVSQRLESAGIISSAKEFDQYLIQNGHDKRISIGDYSIPAGADFETIAKIITRR